LATENASSGLSIFFGNTILQIYIFRPNTASP